MEFEQEKDVSDFNEAKYQIMRLHQAWTECKFMREKGNLVGWKWKLDSAQIELDIDAKKSSSEDLDYIEKLNKINLAIDKAEENKNWNDLYKALFKKECLLREIQDSSGKGAKWRDSVEDYMSM